VGIAVLLAEIQLRQETPLDVRLALLILYLLFAIVYIINTRWVASLKLLSLKPFQRFGWQSEKFSSDYIFRISSLATLVIIASIIIKGYGLGENVWPGSSDKGNIIIISVVLLILCLIGYLFQLVFFSLHNFQKIGEEILDFQYGINQWYSIILTGLFSLDVFYFNFDSVIIYLLLILTLIYFLMRLFGKIIMLQNNFTYPLLTVFIYLCTIEIVPALVVAKLLFVNT
jgi:hypothetical protein